MRERRGKPANTTIASTTPDTLQDWPARWRALGQPWRVEPEISAKRQSVLEARRALRPDITQGVYPFGGHDLALSRADVEWLLATHENGRGPVEWDDPAQHTRVGLDLRGANLSGADLHGLPLACLCGGLTEDEWRNATARQLEAAVLHLEQADLSEAHLEGALLEGAHLERSRLRAAHLEEAVLSFALLEGAYLSEARLASAMLLGAGLEGAMFNNARLEGANLSNTRLAGAEFFGAHLEGAQLCEAQLGGKAMPPDALKRVRRWQPDFPDALPGAHLGGVFFDSATALDDAVLADETAGSVSVADARWGGANLAVLDWMPLKLLGDEREARRPATITGKPKDAATRLAELRTAVRANRQLTVALRDQGLNEEADRYAYLAQKLQREVLRRQALSHAGELAVRPLQRAQKLGAYVFSLFLDVLAGYGYKPGRSLAAYLLTLITFTGLYFALEHPHHPPLSLVGALAVSINSFHGRGFLPGTILLDDPTTVLAAVEAMVGLVIEISFIATFTQRFFAR
jgi:hypothetical protein